MTDFVTCNCQKSLAKSILSVEKELGIPLDSAETLEVLNNHYGYVKEDDAKTFETLKKQVELDVAAERHAAEHKISARKLNKTAVVLTALDRNLGTLPDRFRNTFPKRV